MKGILLGAALAALGQTACARDYPYVITPGLPAVMTVTGLQDEQRPPAPKAGACRTATKK